MSHGVLGDGVLLQDSATLLVVDVLLGMAASARAVRSVWPVGSAIRRSRGAGAMPAVGVDVALGFGSLAVRGQRWLKQRVETAARGTEAAVECPAGAPAWPRGRSSPTSLPKSC